RARGLDAAQSMADGAGNWHGAWMAGTPTDLAAPILRADATRPQISGDNSVPRRAGRAAFAVRSAPIAAIERRKGGFKLKLPRPTFSASGRGRGRAAGHLAHRAGASVSGAAGAADHRHRPWQRARHRWTPAWAMAV